CCKSLVPAVNLVKLISTLSAKGCHLVHGLRAGADASRAALLSLCFESEISFRWRSGTYRDFLRLRAIGLLPSRQRIVARRHVAERVRAVVIAGGGRSLHHRHVAAHPRMNIALHMDCDFLRRP